MKKRMTLFVFLLFFGMLGFSQSSIFPPVEILTLDGNILKASDIETGDIPVILIFWSPDDNKCCNHIDEIQNAYQEAFPEHDLKVIGICCNTGGAFQHVGPYVKGSGWEMEVYIDKTGDFRSFMGVPDVPFTFLFNPEMQVVCRYNGYCKGADDILCEKLRECLRPISD